MAPPVPAFVSAASRALYRSLLRTACSMPDDHRTAFVVHRARLEFDRSRSLTSLDEIEARQLEGEIYRDQLEFQAAHLARLAEQEQNLLIPVDLRARRPLPASPPSPASPRSASTPPPPPPSFTSLTGNPTSRGPSRPARRTVPGLTPRHPPPSRAATLAAPAAACLSIARGPSRPPRPSRPTRPPSSSSPPSNPSPTFASPASPSSPSRPSRPNAKGTLLRALLARSLNQKHGTGLRGRNRFMEGPEPSWVRKRKEKEKEGQGQTGREGQGHKHGEGCGCGN